MQRALSHSTHSENVWFCLLNAAEKKMLRLKLVECKIGEMGVSYIFHSSQQMNCWQFFLSLTRLWHNVKTPMLESWRVSSQSHSNIIRRIREQISEAKPSTNTFSTSEVQLRFWAPWWSIVLILTYRSVSDCYAYIYNSMILIVGKWKEIWANGTLYIFRSEKTPMHCTSLRTGNWKAVKIY